MGLPSPFAVPLAAALLLACQSPLAPHPGRAPRSPDGAGLFPMPSGPLALEPAAGEGQASLADVMRRFGALTGCEVSAAAPHRELLENTPTGLLGPVTVPPEAGWSFVESLLAENGFALAVLRSEPPRLLGVYHVPSVEGGAAALPALAVDAERLGDFADHPALVIRTVLDLPHVDVRALGNVLRGVVGSTGLVPVGGTTSIVVLGQARSVLGAAELMVSIDRARVESSPAVEPPPAERR